MSASTISPENRCQRVGGRAGARARAYSFVELVLESTAIAVGRVTTVGAGDPPSVTLSVTQSIPPGLPAALEITGAAAVLVGHATFAPGETVALFLCSVSGSKAELTGTGDTAKWPRSKPNWMFTPAHVQPIPIVVDTAGLVLAARDARSIDERAKILVDKLWPASPLGRVAAAQLAAKDDFWDDVPAKGGLDRAKVAQLVGSDALLARGPHDPAVDYATLASLRWFPVSIAAPILLDRLDDPDAAARDTAFASLQTATIPLGAASFDYVPQEDAPARAAAIGRWRAFWDGKRGATLRRDVPRLLAGLEAAELTERVLAGRLLRIASGKDPAYEPAAPKQDRDKSAQTFRDWWTAELATLKP